MSPSARKQSITATRADSGGTDLRRSSLISLASKASVNSTASTGSRRTPQEILNNVEEHVGLTEQDLVQPYSELVKYRRVMSRDLNTETWVDVIRKDGKPLRRNVGILR